MNYKFSLYHIIVILCIVVIVILNAASNIRNSKFEFFFQSTPNETKLPAIKPRRFAVFSTSIHSKYRSYIFYAPITAAAWQRLGYEVIVIFVGDFTINSSQLVQTQLNLTERFLKRLNVHTIHFQCEQTYSIKISQLVRIFVGYLSKTIVNDSDYILTTDSDIIPIREEDYRLKDNTTGFIYNAFCCGSFERRNKTYRMYPMSHICLPKYIWHGLFLQSNQHDELLRMNLSKNQTILLSAQAPLSFQTISLYTRHEFKNLFDSNMTKGDAAWYMDQIYSSMLIDDYTVKYPQINIDKRYKKSLRLDPGFPTHMWERDRLSQYGDAHIIHDEIFDSYRWGVLKKLLLFLFDGSLANDFDFYYKQFTLTLMENPDEY